MRVAPRIEIMEDRTLLSPGVLDATFGNNGKTTMDFGTNSPNDAEARAVALQPDGKIVLVGSAQPVPSNYDFAIARLTSSGTFDPSFNAVGKITVGFDLISNGKDRAFGVALQPDGKIVVVGSAQVSATGFDFAVIRLTSTGGLDPAFNGTGKVVIPFNLGGDNDDEALGVALQPDGKIVVAGTAQVSATNKNVAVARLTSSGQLDTHFNGSGKFTFNFAGPVGEGRGVALQPDGNILVAGYAQIAGTNNDFAVARIMPGGGLDPTFNGTGVQLVPFDLGGGKNDTARGVALQPDGRIVLVGTAERQAPNYDFAMARLNANGSLDTTFNGTGKQTVAFDLGGGNDDEATGVTLQAGGKIVVSGFAQTGPTNYDFALVRLTANGSLDPAFNGTGKETIPFDLGGSDQDEAFAAAVQPDGKIVVVGFAQTSANTFVFAAGRVQGANTKFFAVGGSPGRVDVFKPDGTRVTSFAPYGASYAGDVAVAFGDVNGDGIDDLITGAQVGNPNVKVYNGAAFQNGTFNPANPDATLMASFFPYALQFNVGVNVAVGDITGDGYADIVTGASVGNPDVRVYSGKNLAAGPTMIAQWFPYALQFNVGANVAVGDVNGDGFADIVTGATGGNPDVRVYSGRDIVTATFQPTGGSLLAQFFAYGLNFNVGAFVTVGDVTGNGFGDVITGASIGNPEVKVYNGNAIAAGTFNAHNPDGSKLADFFAYDLGANLGVSVSAADFDGAGADELLTGPIHGGTSNYRVVKALSSGTKPPTLKGLEGTVADIPGGILVGA
jgi:uncharacterized delta-60 repeat protein